MVGSFVPKTATCFIFFLGGGGGFSFWFTRARAEAYSRYTTHDILTYDNKWSRTKFPRKILIHATIKLSNLTFVGLCIVIYFYSKTNQMHSILNLFYFGTTFYIFRKVFPSIILRLYIQHQVYAIQVPWLLGGGNVVELLFHLFPASKLFYFGTTLYMFRTVCPSIIRSLRLHTASGICSTGSVAAD